MKRTVKLLVACLTLTPALLLTSCQNEPESGVTPAAGRNARMAATQSIVEIVVNSPVHTLLEAAVLRAGLAGALSGGNLTVFAPTDEAFRAIGFMSVDDVNRADVALLQRVLTYHVLGRSVAAEELPDGVGAYQTLLGESFIITKQMSGVTVNGVTVSQPNLFATNGVVHVVNRVIMPPSGNIVEVAARDPRLTYLVAAVQRASQGSVDVQRALGTTENLTLFAPKNDAFIAAGFPTIESIRAANPDVLAQILLYHVLSPRKFTSNITDGNLRTLQGGMLAFSMRNGFTVKGAGNSAPATMKEIDIFTFNNGVIHLIDGVLLPGSAQ